MGFEAVLDLGRDYDYGCGKGCCRSEPADKDLTKKSGKNNTRAEMD